MTSFFAPKGQQSLTHAAVVSSSSCSCSKANFHPVFKNDRRLVFPRQFALDPDRPPNLRARGRRLKAWAKLSLPIIVAYSTVNREQPTVNR